MLDYWHALGRNPLALHALVIGLLASVACGLVGTHVVTRRITYIAGGIAHSLLAGLGVAQWLHVNHGWLWLQPLHGALAAALISVMVIGWVTLRAREREDTAIGAVWAIGIAIGLIFIHITDGAKQDLMSYLFGNILLVSSEQIWLIALLDVLILAVVILFHPELQAVCFDEEFAHLRGMRVEVWHMLLLVLTALTVVLLVTVVGIVLVIALLTLPAAIAGRLSRSLAQMMALSVALCALCTVAGLSISYQPNLPPGPTIILVAGLLYALAMLFPPRAWGNSLPKGD
jgi:zinc transport system permease protein